MGGVSEDVTYQNLEERLKVKNETLILMHANYLRGNGAKHRAMLRRGFWITNYPSYGCKVYNGTL